MNVVLFILGATLVEIGIFCICAAVTIFQIPQHTWTQMVSFDMWKNAGLKKYTPDLYNDWKQFVRDTWIEYWTFGLGEKLCIFLTIVWGGVLILI